MKHEVLVCMFCTCVFALLSDTSVNGITLTSNLGLRPAMSWYAKASKINTLEPGRAVGYDQTYK